jgi:hypothetical protein
MSTLGTLLTGAVSMGSLVVAVFFLRFWTRTRDTFFIFFAAAFLIEALSRFALAFHAASDEAEPLYYVPRLVAFSLIAIAVVLKNRPHGR